MAGGKGFYRPPRPPLDKTERFMRIYEGAGLRFRLDADGVVVVGIDRQRNWPDGIPALLLQAIEIRADNIAAVLWERITGEIERDTLDAPEAPDGTDEQERLHELITR